MAFVGALLMMATMYIIAIAATVVGVLFIGAVVVIGIIMLFKMKNKKDQAVVKKIAQDPTKDVDDATDVYEPEYNEDSIYKMGPEFVAPSYSYQEAHELRSDIKTRQELGTSAEYLDYECPNCGTPVDTDHDICPNCGEHFGDEEDIEYECPTCGARLDASVTKCPDCGEEFEEADEELPPLVGETVPMDEDGEPAEVAPKVEAKKDMYECPFCHDIVDPDAERCPTCGRAYIEGVEGEEVVEYECPTCGATLSEEVDVCPDCGEKFTD